jgi:LCP family protein required for cell wall assembly
VYRSGRKGATQAARSSAGPSRDASPPASSEPQGDPWPTRGGHWRTDDPDAERNSGSRGRGSGSGGGGGAGSGPGGAPGEWTYSRYRSRPRSLIARLRAESDSEIFQRELADFRDEDSPANRRRRRLAGPWWRRWTLRRVILSLVTAAIGWVLLSAVLFVISAQLNAGNLPAGYQSGLSSAGPILTSANTVLILGLDNRPRTGPGSKEGGLQSYNFSETDANTDTIMLWRVGGGVSRRLSIPRDTYVNVPGHGYEKINAAWSQGGPGLALQVIEQLTGLKINHLIVVDLGNFPKFIDDIGGVTVTTPRICSQISGGAAQGGFTLDLRPGSHHLTGEQALILARTRENSCDPAYNDLNREAMQQRIMNGIKSQLFSVHAFLHLPWAAWDAPGVVQTDMGGLTLLQLFAAAEIGGSTPPSLLSEAGAQIGGADVLIPNQANVRRQVAKLLNG